MLEDGLDSLGDLADNIYLESFQLFYKSPNYDKLTALNIEVIKELDRKVETDSQKIVRLESRVLELEKKLNI